VSVSYTRTEDTWKADDTEATREVQIIGATAGYVQTPGVTLGGKYFQYTHNGDVTASGEEGITASGWGPLVGFYHQSGIFLNAAYLVQPEKVYDDNNGSARFYGGSGMTVDVGKAFELGGFGLGLQMTYSKIEYEKMKADGLDEQKLDGEWSDESVYPHLAFFAYF